jgi:hypothetical protein
VTTGYVLLQDGRPRALVRKHGGPTEDLWFLQEALSRLTPRVPVPDPAKKPGPRRPEPAPRPPPRYASDAREAADPRDAAPPRSRARTPPRAARRPTPEPPPAPPAPEVKDPWTVLGIARGTPPDEARRAFRTLIAQYHPDKVAHLAPEFHALAERRTREILDAWADLERELS